MAINLFNKSSLGLDISDDSIKYIELVKTKKGAIVKRRGEKKLPAGIIVGGKIRDHKWLEQILILLRKEENIKSAHVSLPYELFDKDEQILGVEVENILEKTLGEYFAVFKKSMIAIESMEFEAKAIAQSVIRKKEEDTCMVVDFGKNRTGIFVISLGEVMFTSVFDFGGAKLLNMIKESLNTNIKEAEKIKKEYDLKRDTNNLEISKIFLKSFSILHNEINKHFVCWHLRNGEGEKKRTPIKKIILCGSEANIAGLSEYLSVAMKHKVELANVWANILDPEKSIPEINFEESFIFAPSLGVALNGF